MIRVNDVSIIKSAGAKVMRVRIRAICKPNDKLSSELFPLMLREIVGAGEVCICATKSGEEIRINNNKKNNIFFIVNNLVVLFFAFITSSKY